MMFVNLDIAKAFDNVQWVGIVCCSGLTLDRDGVTLTLVI